MDKIYLHALNLIPKLGSQNIRKLLRCFADSQKIWTAPLNQLKQGEMPETTLRSLIAERNQIDPETEWQKLANAEVQVVTCFEDNYPSLLKEIYSPPVVLYVKGNCNLNQQKNLAVVGTRKNSQYSQRTLARLIPDLTKYFTIVSGLALGVDAVAHRETLANQGNTIAVLGCGLDRIYPRTNTYLAQQILQQGGSLVSEYPLGTQPYKQHFPARNRIISGMSLGTLVIEAPIGSGALITSAFALEQNREVLAVPGSIFSPNSQGTNQLIQMGAKAVLSANNILENFNLDLTKKSNKIILNPITAEEKIICKILKEETVSLDKIISISKLDTSMVNSTLVNLELKGIVSNLGGQNYSLNQN